MLSRLISNTYILILNSNYEKTYNKIKNNIQITGVIASEGIEKEYNYVYVIKEKIIENSNKILPSESSALLIGILLGDKLYMQEDIIESFKLSNLSHVLAVSGAHVSYIILFLKI